MKKKELEAMSLGDRMKHYESQYETRIDPKNHLIIRCDGHKFSKYTKGFTKPFDSLLSKAMELTTIDLVDEYNAVTGYVQSDEITLIIPSLMTTEKHKGTNKPLWEHQFAGRVQKMCSLIAGFTTMRFNAHLRQLTHDFTKDFMYLTDEESYYIRLLNEKIGNAYFDCRMYGVPDNDEAFNSVMWRVRDAVKNSKSMFAQTYCSHKELQGKTGPEQVEYCKNKTGKDWEEIEDRYKYGILVKKEKYMKDVSIPNTGITLAVSEEIQVERTRIVSFSEGLTSYSDENVDLVMRANK